MSIIQKPQLSCEGKTIPIEYRRWVFEHMPAVGRLLDELDAGIIPEWLEVMTALSQCVEYLTTSDSFPDSQHSAGNTSSARYCPFC